MKRKIVILGGYPVHLIPGISFKDVGGTYATWLPQVSRGLEDFEDLEIHWIVFSKGVKAESRLEHKNQTFHVFPRGKTSIATLSAFWCERRKVRKLTRAIGPDVVHAWGTEDVYAIAGADFSGAKMLSMQGILSHYCKVVDQAHFLQRIQAFYERRVLKKYDVVTCESKWGSEILRKLNVPGRLTQLEYGVNPLFFEKKWAPIEAEPNFLFVGTLTAAKGVQDILDLASLTSMSEVTFYLAGSGDMLSTIQERDLPNVKLLGRISPEEVADYLSRCWGLILPTRVDTSPNVVKESRVMGVPVITTPCGGQVDYIHDGENGYLVEPADIEVLESAVAKLVKDYSGVIKLGMDFIERDRDLFRLSDTVEKLSELYGELTVTHEPDRARVDV